MDSEREDIKNIIKVVSLEIVSVVESEESKFIEDEPSLRYVPSEIQRDNQGIITGYSWEREVFIRKNYSLFSKWLSEFLKRRENIKIVELLANYTQSTIENCSSYFERYLYRQVVSGFNPSDVDQLLNDLEKKPPFCTVVGKLLGVVPETDVSLRNNSIRIKQIDIEDMTYEGTHFRTPYSNFMISGTPHSKIEIDFEKGRVPYIQEKFNEILALLSLFRESAISWIGYKIETQSFNFLYSGEMGTSRSMSGSPILLIRDSEQESLDTFITTLEPLMSKIKLRKQPETPIGIAFQRYLDSLQKVSKVEEKILNAIMGLESLYLDNQPEARFRLAIRTARLLGLLNEDSQSVYQKTLQTYGYRSSYVHGSVIKKSRQTEAMDSLRDVQRFLRKSIIYWMMNDIYSKKAKTEFMLNLDASLINEAEVISLKEKTKSVISSLPGVF